VEQEQEQEQEQEPELVLEPVPVPELELELESVPELVLVLVPEHEPEHEPDCLPATQHEQQALAPVSAPVAPPPPSSACLGRQPLGPHCPDDDQTKQHRPSQRPTLHTTSASQGSCPASPSESSPSASSAVSCRAPVDGHSWPLQHSSTVQMQWSQPLARYSYTLAQSHYQPCHVHTAHWTRCPTVQLTHSALRP
jgi:hypothetical protein